MLVERLHLVDEGYGARLLKGVSDKLNPLAPVNRMCFMAKRFLRARSGFNRADLADYFDLLWVATNPPADKPEKAAFVLGSVVTRF